MTEGFVSRVVRVVHREELREYSFSVLLEVMKLPTNLSFPFAAAFAILSGRAFIRHPL